MTAGNYSRRNQLSAPTQTALRDFPTGAANQELNIKPLDDPVASIPHFILSTVPLCMLLLAGPKSIAMPSSRSGGKWPAQLDP